MVLVRQSRGVKAFLGHISLHRHGSASAARALTLRALAPLAEVAGKTAASQSRHTEGQAARCCWGREGRATSQSHKPGSRGSTSTRAQHPTRDLALPVTAPLAG